MWCAGAVQHRHTTRSSEDKHRGGRGRHVAVCIGVCEVLLAAANKKMLVAVWLMVVVANPNDMSSLLLRWGCWLCWRRPARRRLQARRTLTLTLTLTLMLTSRPTSTSTSTTTTTTTTTMMIAGGVLSACVRNAAAMRLCTARPCAAATWTRFASQAIVAKGRLYTKDHEWLAVDGRNATLGITDYAAKALGDIVYVELPKVGTALSSGDAIASVESVKAASDVYCPVNCTITEVNTALETEAGTVNTSPFENGWLAKIEITDDAPLKTLMTPEQYEQFVAAAGDDH